MGEARGGSPSVLGERVVGIAVQPALAAFSRRDHWMVAGPCVCGGVTIRRAVAAERRPAALAGPEMHPSCVDRHAFVADLTLRMPDGGDGPDVIAGGR